MAAVVTHNYMIPLAHLPSTIGYIIRCRRFAPRLGYPLRRGRCLSWPLNPMVDATLEPEPTW